MQLGEVWVRVRVQGKGSGYGLGLRVRVRVRVQVRAVVKWGGESARVWGGGGVGRRPSNLRFIIRLGSCNCQHLLPSNFSLVIRLGGSNCNQRGLCACALSCIQL